MNNLPRLVGRSGTFFGQTVTLRESEVRIGRGPANSLVIADDPEISREHCVVRLLRESLFEIEDCGTLNGTHVNGARISRTVLAHGDLILAGATTFVFLTGDAEGGPEGDDEVEAPQFRPEPDAPGSTVEWSSEEVRRFGQAEAGLTLSTARLEALLAFAASVHSLPDARAVQYRTLEFLFSVLPCEQGATLLSGATSSVGWNREGAAYPPSISRTIFRKVTTEGHAVLVDDTGRDEQFPHAESLHSGGSRSLAAVPFMTDGRVTGLVWLETGETFAFAPDDVRFIAAAAGVAGRAIENIRQRTEAAEENDSLRGEAGKTQAMIGDSPAIRKVYDMIRRTAAADCAVLILGESGTGKELAARAIHGASPRAARRFVAINCAVLSDALLESELFGHERGAFTGAVALKEGKIAFASGGTLFLDEIGELTPAAQAKLLRVLAEGEFERVGGTRTIKADVRILAATNRDLAADSASGRFRDDLYYRLNVVSVHLPRLRDRPEDIPLIAEHWLRRSAGARQIRGMSPEARRCLMAYSWPGNVRELRNAIERAVILGASEWIVPEDLPDDVIASTPQALPGETRYQEGLRRAKKQLVERSLEEAGGDHREAARLLGVHVTYLYRLLRLPGMNE